MKINLLSWKDLPRESADEGPFGSQRVERRGDRPRPAVAEVVAGAYRAICIGLTTEEAVVKNHPPGNVAPQRVP